jgi:hypothetical protein
MSLSGIFARIVALIGATVDADGLPDRPNGSDEGL